MEPFTGFDIRETADGLTIRLQGMSQVQVLMRILLFAKFPRDYQYDAVPLLSPYVAQLIKACDARLERDPVEHGKNEEMRARHAGPRFKATDQFTRAVMACVDDYIAETGRDPADRDALLRLAFQPHTVEGFME